MSSLASREALLQRLREANDVNITVSGRKSKKKRSAPVWFVVDGRTVKLVPMKGTDTPWFKNLVEDHQIGLGVGGTTVTLKATIKKDPKETERVLGLFRTKYRSMWSESYYPKRDVLVEVPV